MHLVVSRKWLVSLFSFATGAAFFRNAADAAALRQAKARDREAFEGLMRQYSSALTKFAGRRLPAGDVEDVLQDTWLAAWERLPTLDEIGRFRPWIFTICYHKIQDSWRRKHSWVAIDGNAKAEFDAAYFPREFARVELQACLASFWKVCPPDQQEVLRMYYGDRLTLNEICQILGRNLNTVKYQFYRAHELAASKLPDFETLLGEGLP